jgi:hypothetical protein
MVLLFPVGILFFGGINEDYINYCFLRIYY